MKPKKITDAEYKGYKCKAIALTAKDNFLSKWQTEITTTRDLMIKKIKEGKESFNAKDADKLESAIKDVKKLYEFTENRSAELWAELEAELEQTNSGAYNKDSEALILDLDNKRVLIVDNETASKIAGGLNKELKEQFSSVFTDEGSERWAKRVNYETKQVEAKTSSGWDSDSSDSQKGYRKLEIDADVCKALNFAGIVNYIGAKTDYEIPIETAKDIAGEIMSKLRELDKKESSDSSDSSGGGLRFDETKGFYKLD